MKTRLAVLVVLAACSGTVSNPDSGQPPGDSGTPPDSGVPDAGMTPDAGQRPDSGTPDAGTMDAGRPPLPDAGASPQLWFYAPFNLATQTPQLEALMDRAADAGYHGLVLADFKLNLLQTNVLTAQYTQNLNDVLAHAAVKNLEVVPEIFPFGYSEGILYGDNNLAEGAPVVGAPFKVSGGALVLQSTFTGVPDPGFETHSGDTFTQWTWQDVGRTFADTSVFHSGAASARIDPGSGNARIVKALTLTPHRQYHLSFWVKTQTFAQGTPQVIVLDSTSGALRNFNLLSVTATQSWTQYDVAFNSMTSTGVNLYAGVWGTMTGTLWFDDVNLQETALVNLIRRSGAPLVAHDSSNATLTEGTDFSTVADPVIVNGFDDWHTPPAVTVPSGSRLNNGDSVTMDFYAVEPNEASAGYEQVGACLTEPAVDTWMHDNITAVGAALPNVEGFFLGYDEMRHMNTCASCKAKGLTAGGLLAWHVGHASDLVRGVRPSARIYVWSDMFDPNHNAHADYYMVDGDIAQSWTGLPLDTVVMNWHLGSHDSLAFFAGLQLPQIIAGYYDSGDGTSAAANELSARQGTPGVIGMMYTTWANDYSQLEAYAASARANW
jgi:hypothetical protein